MTKKKTATQKPKLVQPKGKKRTGVLPGITMGDDELNALARLYVDERDARLQAGVKEKTAKDDVLAAMSRKKKTSYRYDDGDEVYDISVEAKDQTPTLKVKIVSVTKDTDDSDGPGSGDAE